jgi:hypothetical protein
MQCQRAHGQDCSVREPGFPTCKISNIRMFRVRNRLAEKPVETRATVR